MHARFDREELADREAGSDLTQQWENSSQRPFVLVRPPCYAACIFFRIPAKTTQVKVYPNLFATQSR